MLGCQAGLWPASVWQDAQHQARSYMGLWPAWHPTCATSCLLPSRQVDLSSLGRAFSGKTVEMKVPPGAGRHAVVASNLVQ